MGDPFTTAQPSERVSEGRLDSWKEIASYLKRDVTTVQRWEKREDMPVHRHVHDKRGSVYALSSELDAWQQRRRAGLEEDRAPEAETVGAAATDGGRGLREARLRWVTLGAVAAVCCVLAAAYMVSRGRAKEASQPRIRSIAVLPLKNLSGDSSQEYLADGMTDAVIGRLAGIRDLRVVSYTSAARFKNAKMSVPDISKTLGVDALVEGSVIREGDRIRVTAQLIRGATDEHSWSETYDRELRDVLAMQSDIAQAIAEKVKVTVTGEEQQRLTAARPVAPEVYESYLKGMSANNLGSRAGIEEAKADFEDAIRKDPTFAPAYLGLADTYMGLATVFAGAAPPEQMRSQAMSTARKALELDPNLAEAHVLLANVLQEEFHWAEAEAEYRRALDLNPNDGVAHASFADWLLCQGRTDEAIAYVKRGRELDPIAVTGDSVSWILFASRRYDEAIRESRGLLAITPNDAGALWGLGFVLIANNQAEEAVPIMEKAVSLSNSPAVMGVLVRAYAHAGRRADALRLLAEMKERNKKGYVPAAAFVNAYLGLGDNEEAFAWLEQAYKEKSNILQWVKVHPYFDPIRNDPRFVDLVHRVGLS